MRTHPDAEPFITAAELYDGDPLNPGLDEPTPAAVVASLTASQREVRLDALLGQVDVIWDQALTTLLRGRSIEFTAGMFSGGNDSRTVLHVVRHRLTHAIHANTGIGIEQTRKFVRETCAAWALPLLEVNGESYEAMVLERGFPGPAMHWKAYTRQKERAFDLARQQLGISGSRTKAGIFVAGRRRQESERRGDVPTFQDDGTVIWISPIVNWTKLDLNTYQLRHPDLPRNPVADLIHMSGECLCGSFAKPGELDMIAEWFPEVVAYIRALEERVKAAGIPYPLHLWGWGSDPHLKRLGDVIARQLGEELRVGGTGPACSACDSRWAADGMFADFDVPEVGPGGGGDDSPAAPPPGLIMLPGGGA